MKLLGTAFVVGVLATPALAGPDTLTLRPPGGKAAQCTAAEDLRVAIEIVPAGVWIATSGGARCFVARKDGALDAAALDTELASVGAGCTASIEIAAVKGVSYQDVVTAMDHAVKAGFTNVGLSAPKSLSVKLDDSAAKQKSAAAHCAASDAAKPAAPATASKPGSGGGLALPSTAKPDLAVVPVIVITTTDIEVSTEKESHKKLGTVKSLAGGRGAIAALVKLLKAVPVPTDAATKGVLILQADVSTDAAVINRVVESSKAAGFDNILFAIKNK